ncbi:MAG: hypothetical protein IKC81_03780 [Paludibacteraceae bacterium]|nr:hypothetical protein [Paludibacteraceae bacterium]
MKRILFYLFACLFCVACESPDVQPPANENQTEQETPAPPQGPQEEEKPAPPEELPANANGHEYVDLGLSVKWATCNVGANKAEECGSFFAWGEVLTKEGDAWKDYKWWVDNFTNMTKYCVDADLGKVDNKTVLELVDDAARYNWGGSWRMPTKAEQDELREQCTWAWTQKNGVQGYLVTSKKNGKSIFLPAAGFVNQAGVQPAGRYGAYWSSCLIEGPWVSHSAYSLDFNSKSVFQMSSQRQMGCCVRAVLP